LILPSCEIAIVTLHESDELMRAGIAAGARAYLMKGDVDQHLIPVVRALSDHRPYSLR
jgi:DNA-binding NarL/FixJ family response regulator